MKIAIVNDVPAIVAILERVISEATPHEVIWTAADGAQAVDRCRDERPDLVLMDLIMPVMDGVEATRRIMDQTPCAILVVTASVKGNASRVFEALGAGALDAINTPSLGSKQGPGNIDILIRKLATIEKLISKSNTPGRERQSAPVSSSDNHPPLVAIGSSTGGPAALATILSSLPSDFGAAIVVIQHVDTEFAPGLADWLNEQTPLSVRLAREGDRAKPGQVLVAGTGDHLILREDQTLDYTPEPRDYVYRPSVNVFFESAVAHWPSAIIGVLLTGMGRDGATGLLSMRRRGMFTIAQDQDSCAVFGMPKAAIDIDAADRICPVDEVASLLLREVNRFPQNDTAGKGAA